MVTYLWVKKSHLIFDRELSWAKNGEILKFQGWNKNIFGPFKSPMFIQRSVENLLNSVINALLFTNKLMQIMINGY